MFINSIRVSSGVSPTIPTILTTSCSQSHQHLPGTQLKTTSNNSLPTLHFNAGMLFM